MLGKRTLHDASLFFKVPISEVNEHVNHHYEPQVVELEPEDFYIRELNKILRQLKDWTSYYMKSSTITNRDMETMIKLIRETRDTIKTLGEFEGRLNRQTPVQINISMINQRYERLQDFLLNEVCDECRLKVINLMDELKQIPSTT